MYFLLIKTVGSAVPTALNRNLQGLSVQEN